MKNSNRLFEEHVYDRLIVQECNRVPLYLLLGILRLLHLENVLIEKILQIFVGIIDAKLLKAILWKIFKSKNVQN